MELFNLSDDVICRIMIQYIDNSKVNQKKIKFIGSVRLNKISENINRPVLFGVNKKDVDYVDENGNTTLMFACNRIMRDIGS